MSNDLDITHLYDPRDVDASIFASLVDVPSSNVKDATQHHLHTWIDPEGVSKNIPVVFFNSELRWTSAISTEALIFQPLGFAESIKFKSPYSIENELVGDDMVRVKNTPVYYDFEYQVTLVGRNWQYIRRLAYWLRYNAFSYVLGDSYTQIAGYDRSIYFGNPSSPRLRDGLWYSDLKFTVIVPMYAIDPVIEEGYRIKDVSIYIYNAIYRKFATDSQPDDLDSILKLTYLLTSDLAGGDDETSVSDRTIDGSVGTGSESSGLQQS